MEVYPAGVKTWVIPSFPPTRNLPPFNLPKGSQLANCVGRWSFRTQFPAMEFMACQRLSATQQQAVVLRFKPPIAHLQSPLLGMKRENSRHGVGLPAPIGETLPH